MHPDDSSATGASAQADLSRILTRIDEQLAARERYGSRPPEPIAVRTIPPLPDASAAASAVAQLRSSPAPLYATTYESVGKRMPRQIANAALRTIVGRQSAFNQLVSSLAGALSDQILALRHRSELLVASMDTVAHHQEDQAQRTALIEAGMARAAQRNAALESVEASLAALDRRLDQIETSVTDEESRLREEQRGLHRWLDEVVKDVRRLADDQHGISDWVTLVERKVFGLSLAVRDSSQAGSADGPADPSIPDRQRFDAKIANAGGLVKLNIGAGEKTMSDRINVDSRELPEIDVVADVRRLPFEPGSVDEIFTAHLVEHFREHEMRTSILPYWRELLRPGGQLVIVCPNLAACVERLNDGTMSMDEFRLVVYGGQEYEGDDHFAGYTPEGLRHMLEEIGFVDVTTVAEARLDGICPEMELAASRRA